MFDNPGFLGVSLTNFIHSLMNKIQSFSLWEESTKEGQREKRIPFKEQFYLSPLFAILLP